MQGILYAVIGSSLFQITLLGSAIILGTGIVGSGIVRMADNTACLFILLPNSPTAWTYCPNGGGFAMYVNPFFVQLGAIDVIYVDNFFVFLAQGGQQFYNDDGQSVSGSGPPTFTTAAQFPREFGTDPFVAIAFDHREVFCLGQQSSEGYLNAGNPVGSPFGAAPSSFMQIGCHPQAAYSLAMQDQALFWVANDRTVRRKNGQTPQRVSNSGIEAILEHANLANSYALTPTVAGHPLWIYVMPASFRTIAYDTLTQEWFEIESAGFGYYRALSYCQAYGLQLVGDTTSSTIGSLDTAATTEFGQPIETQFISQSIYSEHQRIQHRRLELMITAGMGTSLTVPPRITLYVSNDSGHTFYARESQSLGVLGDYTHRIYWTNLGQSRDRVYKFLISDPTPTFVVDLTAEVEGGKF